MAVSGVAVRDSAHDVEAAECGAHGAVGSAAGVCALSVCAGDDAVDFAYREDGLCAGAAYDGVSVGDAIGAAQGE